MADFPREQDCACRRGLAVITERTRTLYESSPLMYLLLDGQGVIMDGNQRAFLGLGMSLHVLLGTPFVDLVSGDSRRLLMDRLGRLDQGEGGGVMAALELQLRTPSGDLFTSATLAGTCAQDGALVEVHVMMFDVSEVRRLERRMLQADRLASVGQLAAGVAHEINNPASWVMGNLTYLQEHLPLLRGGESLAAAALLVELPQLCQQSLDGMRRIRRIVQDLQLFAREPRAERERVELNQLCDTVVNMAWPEIRRRARLEKSYEELPPIFADAGRLSQVLLNLLLNAAHAIPEGSDGRHKIVLGTTARDGGVVVSVRDTGCGIPRAVLPRIFDPFFTTKAPGKGTGLGLSVSHEIVQAHGGRIEVDSEVGQGTTFTVWLPPGGAEAGPRLRVTEAAEPSRAPLSYHGKILVIDDEPELLRALGRTLRPRHEVILAGSGKEGMEQIISHRDIDVVLCDVMMPETSGMDLYESLPLGLRDRVIFMSGDTASASVHAFLGSLKGPHLQKPVESADLLDVVDQAVQRRRAAASPS